MACGSLPTGSRSRRSGSIVAVPPAIAARIEFDPALPEQRRQLAERLRPGALSKCIALYEEPFWRADGLSGESVTDGGPVTLTFDCSPRDGSAGVMLGFVGGPDARETTAMAPAERRAAVLACFERLFGPRAAQPLDYAEQIWAAEEWSGRWADIELRSRRLVRLRPRPA